MSTTYMVNSTLVFLACHINVVLMTILFLFNISKSTEQHYILNVLQMILYVLGVLFNIYVVLYASRKLELVSKYMENSTKYMRMIQQEIKMIILNSLETSLRQIFTVAKSIIDACSQFYSINSSHITSKPLEEVEPMTTPKEETVKISTKFQRESTFQEGYVTKAQITIDERTPELKTVYNLRPVNRPKSDPIKKTMRNEIVKPQSPELLKNKIFKSKMNLTLNSSFQRQ